MTRHSPQPLAILAILCAFDSCCWAEGPKLTSSPFSSDLRLQVTTEMVRKPSGAPLSLGVASVWILTTFTSATAIWSDASILESGRKPRTLYQLVKQGQSLTHFPFNTFQSLTVLLVFLSSRSDGKQSRTRYPTITRWDTFPSFPSGASFPSSMERSTGGLRTARWRSLGWKCVLTPLLLDLGVFSEVLLIAMRRLGVV